MSSNELLGRKLSRWYSFAIGDRKTEDFDRNPAGEKEVINLPE